MVLVVDLEEDEQNRKRDAPDRNVKIENPTPSCVGDNGASDEGTEGGSYSVNRQDHADIVASKAEWDEV